MARKSVMKKLPKQIRATINAWIAEEAVTVDGLYAYLVKLGASALGLEAVPARSTVGKYMSDTRTAALEAAKALKESREMASIVLEELGPQAAEGEQGRVLVQMMRTLMFRFLRPRLRDGADGEANAIDPKEFAAISRSLRELAQTIRLDSEYEQTVRAAAAKQEREAVAERVAAVGREKGLSLEMIRAIEESVLGVPLTPGANGEPHASA